MSESRVRMPKHSIQDMLKKHIRTILDFPKEGILFRDISSLFLDAEGWRLLSKVLSEYFCDNFASNFERPAVKSFALLEARGFLFAGVAAAYGAGVVLVRKKGKLPGKTVSQKYDLEYGSAEIEIHKDSINPSDRVVIIDDLLATGGTALAAAKLVESLGGVVVEIVFVIDLPELGGRQKLLDAGYDLFICCEFEGE